MVASRSFVRSTRKEKTEQEVTEITEKYVPLRFLCFLLLRFLGDSWRANHALSRCLTYGRPLGCVTRGQREEDTRPTLDDQFYRDE
jgi:hypothetical protein